MSGEPMDLAIKFVSYFWPHRPKYEITSRSTIRAQAKVIIQQLKRDVLDADQQEDGKNLLDFARNKLFGFEPGTIQIDNLNQIHADTMGILTKFRQICVDVELFHWKNPATLSLAEFDKGETKPTDEQIENEDTFLRALNAFDRLKKLVDNTFYFELLRNRNQSHGNVAASSCVLAAFGESQKAHHVAYMHVMDCISSINGRKYDGCVYKPKLTPDGVESRAFERYMTIDDFVARAITMESNAKLWIEMTSTRATMQMVHTLVKESVDSRFPPLTEDRDFFSFHDGALCVSTLQWYPHVDGELADLSSFYGDKDGGGVTDAPKADPDRFACQYFDQSFCETLKNHIPEGWNVCDLFNPEIPILDRINAIDVPAFTSIFEAQQLVYHAAYTDDDGVEHEEENADKKGVFLWALVMLGRMFHNIGTHDDWEIAIFCKGRAMTGKSTLCKFWESIYRMENVGSIENKIEQQFGLAPLAEKSYVVISSEVKTDFQLNQADLQKIISGEKLSTAKKNKDPIVVPRWLAPYILAGNEIPRWVDAQMSIGRRFFILEFLHRIEVINPRLFKEIIKERPAVILLLALAYMWGVEMYANHDLWLNYDRHHLRGPDGEFVVPDEELVFPRYCHQRRRDLERNCNTLRQFIETSDIINWHLHPENEGNISRDDLSIPFSEFTQEYRGWCSANSSRAVDMTKTDAYESIFTDCDIVLNSIVHHDGTRERMLFGVSKMREDEPED